MSDSSSSTQAAPEHGQAAGPEQAAGPKTGSEAPALPIFHMTHWKAGSEWVRAVLHALAPDRFVPRKQMHGHLYEEPLRPGGIYSPIYLHRWQLEKLVTVPHTRFVVLRDLRDTLVSWYFSARYSHPTETNPGLADRREDLEPLSKEDGIMYMLEHRLNGAAIVQWSWFRPLPGTRTPEGKAKPARPDEFIVRYEDLWADQVTGFGRICEHIGLNVSPARLKQVVERFSFQSRSGGRQPGEEDVKSHFRKGVPGDWRNHFTPRISDAFKERFNRVLIAAGYEESDDW